MTTVRDRIVKDARPHLHGWACDAPCVRAWWAYHPGHPPAANGNRPPNRPPSWRAGWAEMIARAVG